MLKWCKQNQFNQNKSRIAVLRNYLDGKHFSAGKEICSAVIPLIRLFEDGLLKSVFIKTQGNDTHNPVYNHGDINPIPNIIQRLKRHLI